MLTGVEVVEVKQAQKKRRLGQARFVVARGTSLTREEIVAHLAQHKVYVYSLDRSDRRIGARLRDWRERSDDHEHDLSLIEHATMSPVLAAFAAMRGFKTAVRAANSPLAVTPRVEALLSVVDLHAALLRSRGLGLQRERALAIADVEVELGRLPTSTKSAVKRWSGSGQKMAAAARLVEVSVFEHYLAELQLVAREAKSIAARLAANPKNERAAAQHQALAAHARGLAELIEKGLSGLAL